MDQLNTNNQNSPLTSGERERAYFDSLPKYTRRQKIAVATAGVILALGGAKLANSNLDNDTAYQRGPRVEVPADNDTHIQTSESTDTTYIVKEGDTAWGIAREHDPKGEIRDNVDDITDQSNKDGQPGLQPGEVIKIEK